MAQSEGVITSAASEAGAPLTADALIAYLEEGEEAIDRLLEAVVAIKRQQRSLDDQLNALLDQLQQLSRVNPVGRMASIKLAGEGC